MHQNNIKKNNKEQSWEAKARWNVINKYQFHAEVCAGNWGEKEGTRTFYSPCLIWAWSSGTKCVTELGIFSTENEDKSSMKSSCYSQWDNKTSSGWHEKHMSRTLYSTPCYVLWCCICLETSLSSCLGFILSFIAILAVHLVPTQGLCLCFFLAVCTVITHLIVKLHKTFHNSEFRYNINIWSE